MGAKPQGFHSLAAAMAALRANSKSPTVVDLLATVLTRSPPARMAQDGKRAAARQMEAADRDCRPAANVEPRRQLKGVVC